MTVPNLPVADGFLARVDGSGDAPIGWILYGRPPSEHGLHAWTRRNLQNWRDVGRVLSPREVPWVHSLLSTLHHPAALFYRGRAYLFFETAGQIGAAWAPSPAGPFTVRRTPIVSQRKWGRATDPSVLSLPVRVDAFGRFEAPQQGELRTDWLLWGGNCVTLCTLSRDRMELAFGLHRSRVIRWTPPRRGAGRPVVRSPQVVPLQHSFTLLWIDGSGSILTARAARLDGPWRGEGRLVFAGNAAGKPPAKISSMSVAPVASGFGGAREGSAAVLTLSGERTTLFYTLQPRQGRGLIARAA